jgi:iron(III) transport system substrate-binding protein
MGRDTKTWMRTFPRTLLGLVAVALIALVLPGCGSSDKPGDGKIIIYSGRSESLVKPVLENFSKATGVQVEVRYGDTAAMAAQLLEEGDSSPADVFLAQDAGALGAVAKKGLFAPLPAEVLSKVPERYHSKNGQWVGVTGRSRVLVYNVNQVPAADLPTSVFELANPKWRGKVGVAPTNGSFQAFVTALRVQHGDERARQFLTGLKANDAQIRENNVQIVSDVNDGKLAVGLVNHYYVFAKAKELGTTADKLAARLYFFPAGDTGALVNVSGIGVMKKAATDPDARALADYLLGNDGQTYFAQQTFEYPLVAGVPTAPGLPALTSLQVPAIDLNDLDTLQATVQMIKDAGLA